MGDFDNIKDKLLNYQSPLDTGKEWEELILRQENVTLKKELKVKNIIGGALGIGLLLLGGIWVMMSLNNNLNETTISNTHSNNQTTDQTETTDDNTLNSEETIKLNEALTTEKVIGNEEIQTLEEVSDANEMLTLKKASISTKIKKNSTPKNQASGNNTNVYSTKKATFYTPININSSQKQKISPQKTQENIKSFIEKTNTEKSESQNNQPIVQSSAPTPQIQTNEPYKTVAQLPTKQFSLTSEQTNTYLLQTARPAPPKYRLRDGKNFIGLELLGQGGFYSLNYGRVLYKWQFGETDIQLGVSRNPRYVVGLPNIHILMGSISIHQSFRIYRPHHLTIGLAAVFGHRTTDADTASNSYYNLGTIVPKIGYRYHAPGSRISYKAELIAHNNFSYTSIGENMEIPPRIYPNRGNVWGGIGIAYHF